MYLVRVLPDIQGSFLCLSFAARSIFFFFPLHLVLWLNQLFFLWQPLPLFCSSFWWASTNPCTKSCRNACPVSGAQWSRDAWTHPSWVNVFCILVSIFYLVICASCLSVPPFPAPLVEVLMGCGAQTDLRERSHKYAHREDVFISHYQHLFQLFLFWGVFSSAPFTNGKKNALLNELSIQSSAPSQLLSIQSSAPHEGHWPSCGSTSRGTNTQWWGPEPRWEMRSTEEWDSWQQ